MPDRHKMQFAPAFPTLARLQDSREKGCSGIFHCSRGSLSVGLMTRRTRNTTTSAVLNANVLRFWFGSAIGQEVEVMSAGETARPAATARGAATSDFGQGARYYQQGNYVQAELTYRRVQASMEKTLGPDDPGLAGVLRLLAKVNLVGLPPAKPDRSFPSAHSLSFAESR
jgi:hypothetical protein